jgi:hypothetical protein
LDYSVWENVKGKINSYPNPFYGRVDGAAIAGGGMAAVRAIA